MLIPLGTDRPLSRPTLVTHILVWTNVAVFAAMTAMKQEWWDPGLHASILDRLILDPHDPRWWAFFSYAFLHGGLMHILGNMLFLWVFGPNVEDRFGRIGFLLFYLGGAGASGGLHVLFDKHPVLGASGAIAAITGAYLVLFPRTNVKALLIFYLIGVYSIPAGWFIAGQIIWDLLSQATGRTMGVATLAHLGGYGFGAGVSLLLLATGILKREMYDLFSISRHAARRRQFRELSYQRQKAAATGQNPDFALRDRKPGGIGEAVMAARGEVTQGILDNDLPGAAAAYRRLLERHGATPAVALLNRKSQYDLANHLFSAGDHQTAATAYDLFREGYPTDSELPVVRLMLGLISARYLNDPVRAKREINEAIPGLPEGDHKVLARELLAELG